MKHQHPIQILRYSAKNLWLMIFPLLRGLMAVRLDVNELYTWLKGSWFDLIVILGILAIGYIRWLYSRFEIKEKSIVTYNGIFLKQITTIPYSSVSSVTAEHIFYLRPFKAVRLNIDTGSGVFNTSDMTILIRRSDFNSFQKKLPVFKKAESLKYVYKSNPWAMVFFSFLFSSTISGVIYIATLFFESGKIMQDIFEKRFTETITEMSSKLALGLPPLAIGIALAIIISWLISFIMNLFRYLGFEIEKDKRIIRIKTGLLTRRQYNIALNKVNYVDLRQSMLTKICSVMSINVNCAGYGKGKNEVPVFIPMMPKKNVLSTLKILMPNMKVHKNQYKPKLRIIFRYIWFPFILTVILPIAWKVGVHFLGEYRNVITFALIMLEIPMGWLLLVKLVSFITTGFWLEDGQVGICYCNNYAFHTILAEQKNICKLQIKQNWFQKNSKSCDIIFSIHSEMPIYHRVNGLPQEVMEFLNDNF